MNDPTFRQSWFSGMQSYCEGEFQMIVFTCKFSFFDTCILLYITTYAMPDSFEC